MHAAFRHGTTSLKSLLNDGGLDHASRASEKLIESTPSVTSENALLANRTKITFIIDLALL